MHSSQDGSDIVADRQNGSLNATDLVKAAKLGLGDHLVADLHVGATGSVAEAETFFAGETAGAGAINCEVNAGIHTVLRGLTEAQVRQRTASDSFAQACTSHV